MKHFLILCAALLLGACAMDETLEPPAELLEFEQRASFDRTWSRSIGELGPRLRLGLLPVTDGENVYAADYEGAVHAFRLADGKRLWQFDTSEFRFWGESSAARFSAGPAVDDGKLAVGTLSGDVLLLDIAGNEIWRANVHGELLAPPLLVADLVAVRTTDGRVVALDIQTGEQRWDTVREVPSLVIRGLAAPTSDGRRIYAGFDNGKVAALSIGDGSMIWESTIAAPTGASELENIVDVDGNLVHFAQEVYATSYNGHAAALAAESGEIIWRRELSSVNSPAIGQGDVFVTDVGSVVRAFDRLSGTTVWTQDKLRARGLTAPAVLGNLVVVGDFEGYLHFLDIATGEMVARISHGGEPLNAPPLVIGDLLIVLSGDGELSAYRRKDSGRTESQEAE